MVGFVPGSIQTVYSEAGLKPQVRGVSQLITGRAVHKCVVQTLDMRTKLLEKEAEIGEQDLLSGSPSRYGLCKGMGTAQHKTSAVHLTSVVLQYHPY